MKNKYIRRNRISGAAEYSGITERAGLVYIISKEDKIMFKKFIERIIAAENREDAIQNIFYGIDGIDIAYQKEKITWKEHQMLLALIEKLA